MEIKYNRAKNNPREAINRLFPRVTAQTANRQEFPTAANLLHLPNSFSPWENAPSVTVQLNLEQLTAAIDQYIRAMAMGIAASSIDEDDWSLTGEQMLFMFQHHNMIESASSDEDIEQVLELAASDEFVSLFGEIGIDEARDRYLTMLEEGRA